MEKCADCGRERPWLNSHHIIPRSKGGTDDPSNLVRLCPNCHEDRHGGPYGGTLSHGNEQSPEVRAKRSAAMRERWRDPDFAARTLAAQRAGLTPDKLKARNAAIAAAHRRPDVVARKAAASLEVWRRPGYSETLSEKQKARYSDPEERTRTGEAVKAGIARSPKRSQWGKRKKEV